MNVPETDRVIKLNSIMAAQSDELALDALVVISKPEHFTGLRSLEFRELKRNTENIRQSKKVSALSLNLAVAKLAEAKLCVLRNYPYSSIQPTKLSTPSLEAYRIYEETLTEPYINYGTELLRNVMSESEAERMAKDLLYRPFREINEEFSELSARTSKEYRGFYRFPVVLNILAAQSTSSRLAMLFNLSRKTPLPGSLKVLEEFLVGNDERAEIIQQLSQRELLDSRDVNEPEITSLGEDSLKAFNAYYTVLENLL